MAFAGTEVHLETRADPLTERIALEPDQVAMPGLTDAHLHLADAALAARHVDLQAPTARGGLALDRRRSRAAGRCRCVAGRVRLGLDRWGRWPTADDLERVAPGRRVRSGRTTITRCWSATPCCATPGWTRTRRTRPAASIRRTDDGAPTGVLLEAAARLVTVHSRRRQADLEAGDRGVARELVSLGVVAGHDPGGLSPDPDLTRSFPAYASLSDAGRLPIRVHASLRDDALDAAIARGSAAASRLGETRTAMPVSAG